MRVEDVFDAMYVRIRRPVSIEELVYFVYRSGTVRDVCCSGASFDGLPRGIHIWIHHMQNLSKEHITALRTTCSTQGLISQEFSWLVGYLNSGSALHMAIPGTTSTVS